MFRGEIMYFGKTIGEKGQDQVEMSQELVYFQLPRDWYFLVTADTSASKRHKASLLSLGGPVKLSMPKRSSTQSNIVLWLQNTLAD